MRWRWFFAGCVSLIAGAVVGTCSAETDNRDRTKMCERIAREYQIMLARHSKNLNAGVFRPDEVLHNLSVDKSGVITIARPLATDISLAKLAEWAKAQSPAFIMPAEQIDSIAKTYTRATVDHLPNTNLYSVNGGDGGNLGCDADASYFKVENGSASVVSLNNSIWSDPKSCDWKRAFGTIDGTPAAFRENWQSPEIGAVTLSVAPWRGDGFGPSCSATFYFSQRFGHVNSEDFAFADVADKCSVAHCDHLKRAVWILVREAQRHSHKVIAWRNREIAHLTPSERKQYETMASQTDRSVEDTSFGTNKSISANNAITESPLLVPLKVGPNVYLAKVGHMFNRYVYPQWTAQIEHLNNDILDEDRPVASFVIDMKNGRLARIVVK